jgi:hypothetical protein
MSWLRRPNTVMTVLVLVASILALPLSSAGLYVLIIALAVLQNKISKKFIYIFLIECGAKTSSVKKDQTRHSVVMDYNRVQCQRCKSIVQYARFFVRWVVHVCDEAIYRLKFSNANFAAFEVWKSITHSFKLESAQSQSAGKSWREFVVRGAQWSTNYLNAQIPRILPRSTCINAIIENNHVSANLKN